MDNEVWVALRDSETYEISDQGSIRKYCSPFGSTLGNSGPRPKARLVDNLAVVRLYVDDQPKPVLCRLDRLVVLSFNEDVYTHARLLIDYIDGDPMNCALDNLEWDVV